MIRSLVYSYGTAYDKVLVGKIQNTNEAIAAQVRYAVRVEMAKTLKDVILRRTELGSAGLPDLATIRLCGNIMAEELNWTYSQTQIEIQSLIPSNAVSNRDVVPL